MLKDVLMKLSAVAMVLVLVGALGWLLVAQSGDDDGMDGKTLSSLPPLGHGLETPFLVVFSDPSYEVDPLDYSLPLTEEQVANLERIISVMDLTPDQLRFLLDNGMVGVAENGLYYVSFSEAYEYIQSESSLPTFITSDSILDAYHHIFEGILIDLECKDLSEQARVMAGQLMWTSDAQVSALLGDDQDLAMMNVVYFGVALRIFDPTAAVPEYAEADIDRIVGMIDKAKGELPVPGFHQKEDFTQYKPRGHYTRSEELERYFKGMMWFGRITFQGKYDDETRRAVLAAKALADDQQAWNAYVSMSNVIDFMVGQPDDLTPHEVLAVAEEVMGSLNGSLAPLFDDAKLHKLQASLKELRPPRINSDIIDNLEPGQEDEFNWGMRVFGQRYVPDSYIFQELVNDRVPLRYMPTCLDVFAVMGSQEAMDREAPETSKVYGPTFETQMTKLVEEFEAYPDETWTQTLYWSWLHSLKSLHEPMPDQEGPGFMQTKAWSAKELNTQAGSWTQLTHDTLLYRKQSYTLRDSCAPTPSDVVYVEPVPILYSRIGDMVEATQDGLAGLGMGSHLVFAKLASFADTLQVLERVAIAELEGRTPDASDVSTLRKYHSTLDGLNEMADGEDTKTVLVSDVHSDPNSGRCLQEGVGYVRLMVVVVPTEGANYATLGAVYEHYEFTHPMSDRLTDEQWTAMLEGGTAPDPAPWARDFNP